MIKRVINKILKSIDNLPAQYKVALARILTGMIESIDYINKKIENLGGGDWNENDNTKPGYIKNRTHYRESVLPAPIVEYAIQGAFEEGTIEDVLNYLDYNTYINIIDINCGKYKYIKNNNEVINNLKIGYDTDAETGEGRFVVSLYDNDTWIENLIVFENIYGVNQEKEYFLNIINLFCDNIDDVYRLKKSITINNVNYVLDESELEYIYHKLDKNYLPDINIITKITYNELKTLRDNSQLIPGMQYRITDYQCTTTQTDTRSAGHQFDIIVVADDVNKLNKNARACLHEGDTYFSNSKLETWELKYSLDNDTNRFEWADTENGKGVVYWMKDERYNECSYDFKNIQFKRYAITNIINTYPKTPTQILNKLNTLKYSQSGKYYSHKSSNIVLTYSDSSTPYTITLVVDSNNFNWYYTFNEQLNNNNNNTIIFNKDTSNKLQLLNIVIIGNAYKNYICINGKANTTFNNCIDSTIYSLFNCILDLNNCRILNNFYNNIGFDNLNSIYDYITSSIICGGDIDIKKCDKLFLGTNLNNIKLRKSSYIIIGYNCNNIIIVNSIRININNYKNNIIINNSDTITFEKEYMFDIIIEHNNNINITSAQTTSYSNKIQNIKINGSTNVTTTPKTISHDTVNDAFQTVYKNANSKEVIVE